MTVTFTPILKLVDNKFITTCITASNGATLSVSINRIYNDLYTYESFDANTDQEAQLCDNLMTLSQALTAAHHFFGHFGDELVA